LLWADGGTNNAAASNQQKILLANSISGGKTQALIQSDKIFMKRHAAAKFPAVPFLVEEDGNF